MAETRSPASLLTDPEWDIRMGGPGTSDRFECRLDLQKGSHIPSQGRPRTRVQGHVPRFVALAMADKHLPLLFSKTDIPQVSAAHSPMRMPV